MTAHEIIYYAGFLMAMRIGFLWGYSRKCREVEAKKVVDSLEVVEDMETIEYTHFIDKNGESYEIWITGSKVYSIDSDHFPDFEWRDEFSAGTCVPVLLIPTTNVSGFYKNRLEVVE